MRRIAKIRQPRALTPVKGRRRPTRVNGQVRPAHLTWELTMLNRLARLFARTPARRATGVPRNFVPRLEGLENREVPLVTYHGGAVLPHEKVQALYYGSD